MDYLEFLNFLPDSTRFRPGMIRDIYLQEGRLMTEIAYEFQELVSPTREAIFSFYVPSSTLKIDFIKMNLYFPGLQVADYPENSSIIYIPPLNKGTIEYINGAFSMFGQAYHQGGTGAGGTSYLWYRAYQKFNVSPLFGLKLKTSELRWLLASKAFAGSGPNAQHSLVLHALDDYGALDKDDWSMTAQVDYGNVNVYTDPTGDIYSKDVKTRVQTLADGLQNYAAFRFVSSGEPTDTGNANNYRINDPILYCELEEDIQAPVGLYINNGQGFGDMLNAYSTNQEDVDITKYFGSTGKKQIKFNCPRMRRIEVLLRIAIKQKAGGGE